MVAMRVLLVESTPGHGAEVARWLHEAGHETATCFEPPIGLACRGVHDMMLATSEGERWSTTTPRRGASLESCAA